MTSMKDIRKNMFGIADLSKGQTEFSLHGKDDQIADGVQIAIVVPMKYS